MTSVLLTLFALLGILPAQSNGFRPEVPPFYSTLAEVRAAVETRCDEIEVRDLNLLLDVARESQRQIDCQGFEYRGKKRLMELMFSDDELDLVIVLLDADDHPALESQFREAYGEALHDSPIGLFFYDSAVALRTRPHEVVFVSKRARANYQVYMDSMAREAGGGDE